MHRPLALALLLCGCPSDVPSEKTPAAAPDGFEYGDEVPCAAPFEGIDRFREEGVQRGLTRPLSDPGVLGEARQYGRGAGLVVRDFDADGDLDLLFGRLDGPPDLYANAGDGTFERVPDVLAPPDGARVFVTAAVDLTGDRLPDVVIGAGQGWFSFANLGGLGFGPATPLLAEAEGRGLSFLTVAFGDADGDGDLDIALPSIGTEEGEGAASPRRAATSSCSGRTGAPWARPSCCARARVRPSRWASSRTATQTGISTSSCPRTAARPRGSGATTGRALGVSTSWTTAPRSARTCGWRRWASTRRTSTATACSITA